MEKNIANSRDGVVLILVLIVLVAAIILGVMTVRTSSLETRMAGNERRYITQFADLESAISETLEQNSPALASLSVNLGATYTYPDGTIPDGTSVTVTLDSIKKAPKGKGYDPSFKTRYYTFEAEGDENEQKITVGAYKVFPPQ